MKSSITLLSTFQQLSINLASVLSPASQVNESKLPPTLNMRLNRYLTSDDTHQGLVLAKDSRVHDANVSTASRLIIVK